MNNFKTKFWLHFHQKQHLLYCIIQLQQRMFIRSCECSAKRCCLRYAENWDGIISQFWHLHFLSPALKWGLFEFYNGECLSFNFVVRIMQYCNLAGIVAGLKFLNRLKMLPKLKTTLMNRTLTKYVGLWSFNSINLLIN